MPGSEASKPAAREAMAIRNYAPADFDAVAGLWTRCGLVVEYNPPEVDIALCSKTPSSELFVGLAGDTICASIMAGSDGHRGWLYYLAVAPEFRQRGLGRQMVSHAEDWLAGQGVRKVHLMIRETNLAVKSFYRHIGYGDNPCPVLQRWLVDPYASRETK